MAGLLCTKQSDRLEATGEAEVEAVFDEAVVAGAVLVRGFGVELAELPAVTDGADDVVAVCIWQGDRDTYRATVGEHGDVARLSRATEVAFIASADEGGEVTAIHRKGLGQFHGRRGSVGGQALRWVADATDTGFSVGINLRSGAGQANRWDHRPASDFTGRGTDDEFSGEALALGRARRRRTVSAGALNGVEVLLARGEREAAEEDLAATHDVGGQAAAVEAEVGTIGAVRAAVLHTEAETEDETRGDGPFEADRSGRGPGVQGRGQSARVFGKIADATVEPPAKTARGTMCGGEARGAILQGLVEHRGVEVKGDGWGGEAHAAGEAALEDGTEAIARELGGAQRTGGHDRRAVGGGDHQAWVDVAREGHAVDQHAVNIFNRFRRTGASRRGDDAIVGRAQHRTVRGDEVVVIADEHEVIVRIGRIEAGHDREGFPLLGEGVDVLRLHACGGGGRGQRGDAEGADGVGVEAEAGELADVEEVDEIGRRGGDDAGDRRERRTGAGDGRGVTGFVGRAREVSGIGGAHQGDALEDLRVVGEAHVHGRGLGAGVAGAITITVAGQHHEGAAAQGDDFGLGGRLVGGGTDALAAEGRELDEVMADGSGRRRVLRDIVNEETGVGAVVVEIARRILAGRALEHRHEELTVGGNVHGFHALVIAAATRLYQRVGGFADIDAGNLGGEASKAGSLGELRDQRLDGRDDT